jgi:murein DD-endopeptidase MepM/ murein hydrolase activator NlpD
MISIVSHLQRLFSVLRSSSDRRFRKGIARSFLLAAVLVAAGVGTFSWFMVPRSDPAIEPIAAPVHAVPAPIAQVRKLITHIVKPGDTFAGILVGLGVSHVEAATCYRSLSPLGFASLFPGDSLAFGLDPTGAVDTMSLLSRMACRYHLARSGAGIRAVCKPIIVATYRCIIKGELTRSLSEDMFDCGAGDALVAKFADIFAWDINFFTDLRKGDRFEVLYEKKFAEGRFTGYGDIIAARYVAPNKTFTAIAFADSDRHLQYYDENGKSVQKQFLKAPLRFTRISSGYTWHRADPIQGIVRPHLGIDFAAPVGTPVYSPADGKVIFAGVQGGFGNHIILEHGGSYRTYYGHLSAYAPGLHVGQRVAQGDLIGRVGTTGWSTGPHLDYRMTVNGAFVNSQTIRLPSKKGIDSTEQNDFAVVRDACYAIMSQRFGAKSGGYWVLDINDSAPDQPAVTTNLAAPRADHGITPGS